MINIGQFNTLTVIKILATGAVLDGGRYGNILLTHHQAGESYSQGESVNAFIYLDSEGELAATTKEPLVQVGKVAWLKVVDVNQIGAFVDWGLSKDLFIPFAEQQHELQKGKYTLVKAYLDNQNRITGSTRIDHWIKDDNKALNIGEQVSLIIAEKTELGYKAVINHQSWGLLYDNELFTPLRKGQSIKGYVKKIRKDDKVDLSLNKPGFNKNHIDTVAEQILNKLQEHDGRLLLTDKSPPEAIYAVFGVSKKVFKQAIGSLYKKRYISLDPTGITLNKT